MHPHIPEHFLLIQSLSLTHTHTHTHTHSHSCLPISLSTQVLLFVQLFCMTLPALFFALLAAITSCRSGVCNLSVTSTTTLWLCLVTIVNVGWNLLKIIEAADPRRDVKVDIADVYFVPAFTILSIALAVNMPLMWLQVRSD